jgi:hypothetical protein
MAVSEQETRLVPKRAWEIIVEARRDGWYEDHSGWRELDEIIRAVEQQPRCIYPDCECQTSCERSAVTEKADAAKP